MTRRIWVSWLIPLLLCSCSGGDDSPTDPGDGNPPPSDISLTWLEPDPLHNVVAAPYELRLGLVGGDPAVRIGFEVDGKAMGDLAIQNELAASASGVRYVRTVRREEVGRSVGLGKEGLGSLFSDQDGDGDY